MRRDGLSLLEVLVALSVLTIGLVAVVPSFTGFLRVNTGSEVMTDASNVAQTVFEGYRLQDPTSMPTSGTETASVVYQGRTFQVATTYCAQTAYCGPGSRDIQVTVSYENNEVFRAETVYTQVNVSSN